MKKAEKRKENTIKGKVSKKATEKSVTSQKNQVKCVGLKKKYGRHVVLKPLDMIMEGGKIYGIFGPRGCGKSVLMKLISGMIQPTEGEVYINGLYPCTQTKLRVSYLPDLPCFNDNRSVGEIVGLYRDFFEDFDEKRALKIIGRMGVDLNEKYKNMSRSTQRRIEVILVMSRRADVYLLDEPIACVEPNARDFVIKTILNNYKEGSVVIIGSKITTDIYKIVDDVAFMHRGDIKLKSTVEDIRVEYGKEVDALYKEVFRC